MVSGGEDEMIYLWDLKAPYKIKVIGNHRNWINSLCIFNNEKFIVSCSLDKTVKVWDITSSNN